jgi:hypothetical protein
VRTDRRRLLFFSLSRSRCISLSPLFIFLLSLVFPTVVWYLSRSKSLSLSLSLSQSLSLSSPLSNLTHLPHLLHSSADRAHASCRCVARLQEVPSELKKKNGNEKGSLFFAVWNSLHLIPILSVSLCLSRGLSQSLFISVSISVSISISISVSLSLYVYLYLPQHLLEEHRL